MSDTQDLEAAQPPVEGQFTTQARAAGDAILDRLHVSAAGYSRETLRDLIAMGWMEGRDAGFNAHISDLQTSPAVKPGAPDDIEALKDLAAIKPESLRP
jgi:hypothetical protein